MVYQQYKIILYNELIDISRTKLEAGKDEKLAINFNTLDLNIQLGPGLIWDKNQKNMLRVGVVEDHIVNSMINRDAGIQMSKTNLKPDVGTFFYEPEEGILRVNDVYVKNTGDVIRGNLVLDLGLDPEEDTKLAILSRSMTKKAHLMIGKTEDEHWQIYNETSTDGLGIWSMRQDRPTMMFHKSGNVSIGSEDFAGNEMIKWKAPADEKLHVFGNVKLSKGDLIISDDKKGICMYDKTPGKVLISDGTRYIPKEFIGDVKIEATGETTIRDSKIYDKHIGKDAKINIAKIPDNNLTTSSANRTR